MRLTVSDFKNPGFVRDTAEYAVTPQAFNEVRNARFPTTAAQSFLGETQVLAPAEVSPTWIKVFPPVEAPIWVYGNGNKMFAFDTDQFEITRASGPYTGTDEERWQGEVFNGVGVFNNVADVPQMWSAFQPGTPLVDLPNWPATLRCKALRPHKNFLFALHTIEAGTPRPYRVRWSAEAAPGTIPISWDLFDPTILAGELDVAETSDYVVDGMTLGELFIVYKQKSVYAFQYLGTSDQVFGYREIIPDKGILWRDCVQSFPGGHFVAGIDDLYVHTGGRESAVSLVEASLRNWIFRQIDSTNYFNCFTLNYVRRNELWFCFPEAGSKYATLAVVWNRLTRGIGVRELRSVPFAYPGPVYEEPSDLIWGDDVVTNYRLLESGDRRLLETGFNRLLES